jgi:biopolymer transport protein ExbB/TolQ
VVSKCSGAISAIYIAFVGISVVGATASVAVNVYQMKNLTKDTEEIRFENGELEEELTALKASKKSAAGAMSGALAAVLPVFGASEEAAPKTPLEEKEDELLKKLEEIRRKQTEIFQKKRKKLRVIAGAAQALIEDLPYVPTEARSGFHSR